MDSTLLNEFSQAGPWLIGSWITAAVLGVLWVMAVNTLGAERIRAVALLKDKEKLVLALQAESRALVAKLGEKQDGPLSRRQSRLEQELMRRDQTITKILEGCADHALRLCSIEDHLKIHQAHKFPGWPRPPKCGELPDEAFASGLGERRT